MVRRSNATENNSVRVGKFQGNFDESFLCKMWGNCSFGRPKKLDTFYLPIKVNWYWRHLWHNVECFHLAWKKIAIKKDGPPNDYQSIYWKIFTESIFWFKILWICFDSQIRVILKFQCFGFSYTATRINLQSFT